MLFLAAARWGNFPAQPNPPYVLPLKRWEAQGDNIVTSFEAQQLSDDLFIPLSIAAPSGILGARTSSSKQRTTASWRPKRRPLSWTSTRSVDPSVQPFANDCTAVRVTQSSVSPVTTRPPSSSLPQSQPRAHQPEQVAQAPVDQQ